jgi:hypothetical protein
MNTTPNNTHTESSSNNFNYNNPQQATIIGAADKPEDNIIMHDARIITPHPYGVYGLCKIIEHLQNN